jgi:hypothetical protein
MPSGVIISFATQKTEQPPSDPATIDSSRLPCWTCKRPEAFDVRHFIGQCDDGKIDVRNLSPGGLPLQCCRVVHAGPAPKP